MPTYEYACKKCGENFEVFQSFSAKPLKKHPDCGGELTKVFHARGVVFKGSGFYATDSRPKEGASSSASSPKAKEGSTSSSSTKTSKDSSTTTSTSSDSSSSS